MKKLGSSILSVTILMIVWQMIYIASTDWCSWVKPYALPNPIGVLDSFLILAGNGSLVLAVSYSLLRVLIGFFIAIVIGCIFGILILNSKFLQIHLKPVLLGIQTLPSICWVPFAILWFGLGEGSIIFVVVMGSAFSIAFAIENGVKNVPPIYIKAARTMGVTNWMLYKKVIIPAALPSFIGGLKQGWSFAWRALMSGEVMSASIGLGYTLMMGRDLADINQVMMVMLVIIMIGMMMDKGIFSLIENRVLRKRGLI